MRLVRRKIDIQDKATCACHFRPHRRISGAGFARHHAGDRQHLGAVANGGDRLVSLREVLHDLQHGLIQAKVFRGAPTRDNAPVQRRRYTVRWNRWLASA